MKTGSADFVTTTEEHCTWVTIMGQAEKGASVACVTGMGSFFASRMTTGRPNSEVLTGFLMLHSPCVSKGPDAFGVTRSATRYPAIGSSADLREVAHTSCLGGTSRAFETRDPQQRGQGSQKKRG